MMRSSLRERTPGSNRTVLREPGVTRVRRGTLVPLDSSEDLTADYPAVRSAVAGIRAERAILDGEIVAVGEHGRPSFQALQYRTAHQASIAYYAFDLLHVDGADLVGRPL